MKRIITITIVLLICLVPLLGLCSDYVESASIYDVENNSDEIRVYAGFFDEDDKSVEFLDEIKADINGTPLEVKFSDVISETEEGTAILFLVDVSGSVKGEAFDAIESSMVAWVDNMGFHDEYAIVSFGEEINEVCYFTYDDDTLFDAIAGLEPNEKFTRLNQALDDGVDMCALAYDDIPSRKVMVMLSDGKNETNVETDISDSDILVTLENASIPVYALGCNYTNKKENEEYLKHMQNMANASNGRYYDIEDFSAIDDVYYDLRDDVNNTFAIDLAFSDDVTGFEKSDEYILTLTGITGTSEASDFIEIELDDELVDKLISKAKPKEDEAKQQEITKEQPIQTPEEPEQSNILVDYWWAIIGILVLILILLLLLLLLKKKNTKNNKSNSQVVVGGQVQSKAAQAEKNIAKPIDPSFVDNLRSESIQKTVSYASEKALLLTIQMPNQSKIDEEIMITDTIKIGSGDSCDITIAHESIPKAALNIIYRDGYMYVAKETDDVNAYINGIELALEVPLKNGDLINIGNALIKVNY